MIQTDTETELRNLFVAWGDDPGIEKRKIICTPHGANYGVVSSWLISPCGSPPRGNLYVDDYQAVLLGTKPRVLRAKELEVVLQFSNDHLMKDRHLVTEPVSFVAEPGLPR